MTMKCEILAALLQAEGYLSGQELCDRLLVSRTAIWKVVNQLRAQGYEIESTPHRGYRILSSPDCVTEEKIGSLLKTRWAGSVVCYREVTDSTNNEARRLAEQGAAHGTLVVADSQSGGKGRRGRSWSTPPGTSVAMSLLVRPELAPGNASMMTLVMGMAVAAGIREMCGLPVSIKWPNDVVAQGRKICGILTEMSCEVDFINYLVIGCGINANMDGFSGELGRTAASLRELTGQTVDRAALIACCLRHFEAYYDRFMERQDMTLLEREYNALVAGKDEGVRVLEPGNEYSGISRGINGRGELLVEREDGSVSRVYAGEVSVRGVYGYV